MIILITGGSRSGKSEYGEKLIQDKKEVLYIATGVITDSEMLERVRKHKERRNNCWKTYEGWQDLSEAIEKDENKYILLDSVTTMLTNIMFQKERDFEKIQEEEINEILKIAKEEFHNLINIVKRDNKNIIMITDEVGSGIIPEYKISRIFRDLLGSLNSYIASISDELYLVCCGIPLKVK